MRLWLLAVSFLISMTAWGIKLPQLTGPVIDEAGILNSGVEAQLSQVIRSFNDQGKAQIQVLTLQSLEGEEIEQASIQITDNWKLGDAKKDNGILFLIVPSEKKMRIEVGQGLEGDVPDAIASRIINDVVKPYFRQSDFNSGIVAGTAAIIKQIDPQFTFEGAPTAAPESRKGKKDISMFVVLFIVLMILSRIGGGRGGRRRGLGAFAAGYGLGGLGGGGFGGSGGGGGWSGGGGGFSGGGSSGNW